jgi:hypothetical protein
MSFPSYPENKILNVRDKSVLHRGSDSILMSNKRFSHNPITSHKAHVLLNFSVRQTTGVSQNGQYLHNPHTTY